MKTGRETTDFRAVTGTNGDRLIRLFSGGKFSERS